MALKIPHVDVICRAGSHADRESKIATFFPVKWLAARGVPLSGASLQRWTVKEFSPDQESRPFRPYEHKRDQILTRSLDADGDWWEPDADLMDDRRLHRKLRCRLCGLDVTARVETLDDVLDRLEHAGVTRIELQHLVAILA